MLVTCLIDLICLFCCIELLGSLIVSRLLLPLCNVLPVIFLLKFLFWQSGIVASAGIPLSMPSSPLSLPLSTLFSHFSLSTFLFFLICGILTSTFFKKKIFQTTFPL